MIISVKLTSIMERWIFEYAKPKKEGIGKFKCGSLEEFVHFEKTIQLFNHTG